jgi:hypothetical protein
MGAVVLVVLLLAAGAIWLMPAHKVVRAFVLPDGTTLSFYKATYGTNHEAFYATDWRDHLARYVPAKYATNLGFKRVTMMPSTINSTSSNNLVVWLRRSGLLPVPAVPVSAVPVSTVTVSGVPVSTLVSSARTVAPQVRATVVDENGLEASATMSSWNGNLLAFLLPNYPRRSRIIHVRFWDSSTPTMPTAVWPLLAEMEIRNPAPSMATPWVAETLPATRVTNGLEISLLKLETGRRAADGRAQVSGFGGGAAPATARANSLVQVDFRENGQPAAGWDVLGMQAAAPTGVSVILQRPFPAAMLGSTRRTADGYNIPGVLWPEEPVWEVTIQVGRTSDFPEEETWRLTGLAIPGSGEGENSIVNLETNISGLHLTCQGLSRRQVSAVYYPAGTNRPVVSTSFSPGPWTLNFAMTNYVPEVQLKLLSLQTDTGQSIRQTGSSSSGGSVRGGVVRPATWGFSFQLPDDAVTVDATVAAVKIRTATFRVKPTLAH